MRKHPNLDLLAAMARLLEPMLDDLVFVGGCATGLLITDPAAAAVRPTRDVDVVTELSSYGGYIKGLEAATQVGISRGPKRRRANVPLARRRSDP